MSGSKAKGKDGWSLPGLRALTEADTDALAQFYSNCEAERKWLRNFPGPIHALIDKDSAIDEGISCPLPSYGTSTVFGRP